MVITHYAYYNQLDRGIFNASVGTMTRGGVS